MPEPWAPGYYVPDYGFPVHVTPRENTMFCVALATVICIRNAMRKGPAC